VKATITRLASDIFDLAAEIGATAEAAPVTAPFVRVPVGFPPDAVIVVADAGGYTDRQMKGPPYIWCRIGGPTWFYVDKYPIPVSGKSTP
jgi:hypothetical protein